ncbi:MAG: HRDC domain-containing protein [Muribaculaceae bacterium]|nr:HRDC domain-containing protein [Muribaculaceae bacterium]
MAENFRKQYTTLQPGTSLINQRITKGAEYFHQHLASLLSLIQSTPQQADNKTWQERLQVAHAEISDLLTLRMALMKATAEAGDFTPTKYLAKKAELLLSQEEPTKKKKREKKEKNSTENKAVITDDIVNPEIYERLVKWRFAEAKRMEVPAFVIFANRDLINIAAALPLSMNDLTRIKGVGKVKANRYGAQVLEIIAEALKGK